jgi:hypothetical protein
MRQHAFYVVQVLVKESDFKSAGTKEPERRFAIVGHISMVDIAVQQESETVRDGLSVVRLRSDSKPLGHRTNTGYVGGPHVSRSNAQRQTESWIGATGRSAHVCYQFALVAIKNTMVSTSCVIVYRRTSTLRCAISRSGDTLKTGSDIPD